MNTTQTINSTKEIVLSFIDALNREDFTAARQYLADDFNFIGVMGSRHGADIYLNDMTRMKFKYDIKKVLADDSDVSLFYDIDMGNATTIFASGWYQIQAGKIKTFKVIFDPRPLLEKQGS